MSAPYLSIVLTGRNDTYGGDFRARFLRTLAFNTRQLEQSGVEAEFVLVEWAPPPAAPLLIEIAVDAMPALAPSLRSVVVDPDYQDALTLNPRIAYLEFIAKNVGIRRARGTFVLTTNADVYLGRHILQQVASQRLRPKIVYRARRIDLKLGLDQSSVDWAMLEDERNYDTGLKPLRPPLYAGGTGDFVLLDAATFGALRGFNEVYRVAKIGIDRNFLLKALHSGLSIRDIGGPVYHVNHVGSYRMTKGLYTDRETEAPYGDHRWPSSAIVYDNGETWGLGAAPAMRTSDTVTRLLFDWNAVSPLVEIDRVIPASVPHGGDSEPHV
jgi:hypothetical protein